MALETCYDNVFGENTSMNFSWAHARDHVTWLLVEVETSSFFGKPVMSRFDVLMEHTGERMFRYSRHERTCAEGV